MSKILRQPDFDPIYKTCRSFEAEEAVFHGFFGRSGGVSEGLYRGLNCGLGSDDDRSSVMDNLQIVAQNAGVLPEYVVCMHQIHSDICTYVERPWAPDDRPQGDAMVTDVPGIAIGVLSADCTPVLFYGQKACGAPVVGAAHAGWKGAVGGVLDATREKMLVRGAREESLKACIGPCIGKKSYEVSEEFYKQFVEADDANDAFFMSAARQGHYMFDLPGYCAFRLGQAGIGAVEILDEDTYSQEEQYFSYRRTTHRKEPDYGRQISVVAIKG